MKHLITILLSVVSISLSAQFTNTRNNASDTTSERNVTNSPGNGLTNSYVVEKTKDSTYVRWSWYSITFTKLDSNKADATFTRFMGVDNKGNIKLIKFDSIVNLQYARTHYQPLGNYMVYPDTMTTIMTEARANRAIAHIDSLIQMEMDSMLKRSDTLATLATQKWVLNKGYLTLEVDPDYHASVASTITNAMLNKWNAAYRDSSASNELQQISIVGNTLMLNLSGGAVVLPIPDTLSLSDRINAKLNRFDTMSLSIRIDNKLSKSDTSTLSARIDNKLNKSDTSSLSNRIDLKLNKSDTVLINAKLDTKLNKSDTSSLSNRIDTRLKGNDTLALSARIDARLKGSDTVGLSNRINSKFTTPTGTTLQYVRGDGSLATLPSVGNASADNNTKGVATFDSSYFNDNGNGLISFGVNYGTGTVASGNVTINQPRGKITVNSPNIPLNASISITFTNSYITSTSTIIPNINGAGTGITIGLNCFIKSQTNGSCVINLLNLSLLSIFNTGLVIDYLVIN